MTRIEKNVILAALTEYIFYQRKLAYQEDKRKNYQAAQKARSEANIARSICEYWKDVLDMPCGSVKI